MFAQMQQSMDDNNLHGLNWTTT